MVYGLSEPYGTCRNNSRRRASVFFMHVPSVPTSKGFPRTYPTYALAQATRHNRFFATSSPTPSPTSSTPTRRCTLSRFLPSSVPRVPTGQLCSTINHRAVQGTVRRVAHSLQDGCLSSVRTSYNEHSELDLREFNVGLGVFVLLKGRKSR